LNQQTVLLVDDDPGVLEMIGKILRRGGYAVVAMARPDDALGWWRTHAAGTRAVVTDVVMPGMTGLALVDELRKDRPEIPVVFISGYPDRIPRSHVKNGAVMLQKPFTSSQLLDALRDLLRE
jgi:DNA-binding NtrC family response regulator